MNVLYVYDKKYSKLKYSRHSEKIFETSEYLKVILCISFPMKCGKCFEKFVKRITIFTLTRSLIMFINF